MKHFFCFLILQLWLLTFIPVKASNCDSLINLSTQEILHKGEESLDKEQIEQALTYFLFLIESYQPQMNSNEKADCIQACLETGRTYFQLNNYNKAFDSFLQGIQICEESNIEGPLPRLYNNLGGIYSSFNAYAQALECYKKGLQYTQVQDERIKIRLLMNLSSLYCYLDDLDEGKKYFARLMNFKGKHPLIDYFYYLNSAYIAKYEEKIQIANDFFQKAISYAIEHHLDAQYTASAYGELAKLYDQTGQKDSALWYLEKNQTFIKENNCLFMLPENLKALGRLYADNNPRKASIYRTNYLELIDSLFQTEEIEQRRNARFTYEMDKNYRKISSLTTDKKKKEAQIKTQKIILTLTFFFLLICIIFVTLIYIEKKKLNKAYKELFRRSNEILHIETINRKLCLNTSEQTKENTANKLTENQKTGILQAINKVMNQPEIYCESNFNLEKLAEMIHSNSKYVSQVINDTYHKNFRSFINEARVNEVQRRLLNSHEYGQYTIKAISESVGYKSYTNFIMIFKKVTGISPSTFQKIAKEQEKNEVQVTQFKN